MLFSEQNEKHYNLYSVWEATDRNSQKKKKKLKNTYRKIWKIGRQLKAGKEGIVAFLMKINTYKYVRKHGGP
jgi:hypothetical protein